MNVLVYGDSNSWGYLDNGTGIRALERWPQVMANNTHFGISLVEACLPGRTTAMDDPEMGPFVNGHAHLLPTLLSHQPLDLVIMMLGTNDFKARFNRPVDAIASSIIDLAQVAISGGVGPGAWREGIAPEICVIAPPALGKRAEDPDWGRQQEWAEGRTKSLVLPQKLQALCQANNLHFVNANDVIQSSELDPIHWSAKSHQQFGLYMAQTLHPILDKVSQKDVRA